MRVISVVIYTYIQANPTVTVIQHLGANSIQINRDSADVLRHIIKNVSDTLGDVGKHTANLVLVVS